MSGLRREIASGLPWPALEWVLRLALAGMWLYASADKIVHPEAFAQIVKGYHILPESFVTPAAIWLPWLELVLGVCLYAGFFRDGALALSTALLTGFWLVLMFNWARGVDVDCGCFSTTPGEGLPMLWYVGRDSLLLALGLAAVEARLRAGVMEKSEAAQNVSAS